MHTRPQLFSSALILVAFAACGAPARAGESAIDQKVQTLDRMMIDLAPESVRDAAEIKRVYHDYLDYLALDGYDDLQGALLTGGLVPLPERAILFNLAPRLDGTHPIGEKDLANQASYVAARPATIGVLLEIASRVHSSPLEITSLVRHGEYQDALRATNTNATTSVPMHTMGLAVDIALVNTPLATAFEVRDVLRQMRGAGDLLFIGERQQLVFHVVPHPSRIGYFNDVYAAAFGAPGSGQAVEVVARVTPRLLEVTALKPKVEAEVVSIVPADAALWGEWFGAPQEVAAPAAVRPAAPRPRPVVQAGFAFGVLPLLGGALAAATTIIRRRLSA